MAARLKEHYDTTVRAKLKEAFGYANDMEIPRIEKIVINMGVGEATSDGKKITSAVSEMIAIGPTDCEELVPNRAYSSGGTMLAYRPATGGRPATSA